MVKIISKYLLVFIYFYFTLFPKRFQVSGFRNSEVGMRNAENKKRRRAQGTGQNIVELYENGIEFHEVSYDG